MIDWLQKLKMDCDIPINKEQWNVKQNKATACYHQAAKPGSILLLVLQDL